jgi:AcrR family transcriptional regulator
VNSSTTQARLLDAAEQLFSERGFQGISVREITDLAKANLAAVNYHFGSKAGLIRALIERHIGPLNELRMQQLEHAETEAGPEGVSLEKLLRIFFTAPIEHFMAKGRQMPNLLARLHQEPTPEIVEVVVSVFRPMANRFLLALQRCLPHLSEEQIFARGMFMKGAMVHAMADGHLLAAALTDGRIQLDDPQFLIDELVAFCANGFQMPGTSAISTKEL